MSRSPRKLVYMNRGAGMSETLLRQWELLRAIPRAPRKIDVGTLMEKLAAAGYRISKRSLQRDLNQLSAVFPLGSDPQSIPYGWSWAADGAAFDLPAMDPSTALTLQLVEKFIPTLLPPTVREHLAPQFARAQRFVKTSPGTGARRWRDCIRVVPREMPLLPPAYDEASVRVVYESLFEGCRFTARYRSRGADADEVKAFEINPLGLAVRGNLTYLVCSLWRYEDVRQLALHRISHAVAIDAPAKRPRGFDLDEYIRTGEFQYPEGPMIRLEARFAREAAAHLYETRLSEDQRIVDDDIGYVHLSATVRHTAQLEWWLLSFGNRAHVLAPSELKMALKQAIATE